MKSTVNIIQALTDREGPFFIRFFTWNQQQISSKPWRTGRDPFLLEFSHEINSKSLTDWEGPFLIRFFLLNQQQISSNPWRTERVPLTPLSLLKGPFDNAFNINNWILDKSVVLVIFLLHQAPADVLHIATAPLWTCVIARRAGSIREVLQVNSLPVS